MKMSKGQSLEKNFHETCKWLRALLGDRQLPVQTVKRAASENGYCWATVKRAKRYLGVETIHQQNDYDRNEEWFWYYPFLT